MRIWPDTFSFSSVRTPAAEPALRSSEVSLEQNLRAAAPTRWSKVARPSALERFRSATLTEAGTWVAAWAAVVRATAGRAARARVARPAIREAKLVIEVVLG